MIHRDERNPLSPNYRRPEPDLRPSKPNALEAVVTGIFTGLLALALMVAVAGLGLSLFYGVVLLIFRHAFGVELPNPYSWLR